MANIYTGYFDNINKYMAQNLNVEGITRFPPDILGKYGLINHEYLAPSKELLLSYKNGEINRDRFIKTYMQFLNDNEDYIHDIVTWTLDKDKDTIWCCFEKPSDFCHRHLLAAFINEHGWATVKEFK